jgi:hypothetical protein
VSGCKAEINFTPTNARNNLGDYSIFTIELFQFTTIMGKLFKITPRYGVSGAVAELADAEDLESVMYKRIIFL